MISTTRNMPIRVWRWKQPASLSSSQRVSERCRSRISTPVTESATEPQCAFVVAGQRAEPGQQSRRDDRSVQFAHERDPRGTTYRWHSDVNGATVYTGGVLGDASNRFDDVVVAVRIRFSRREYLGAGRFSLSFHRQQIPTFRILCDPRRQAGSDGNACA